MDKFIERKVFGAIHQSVKIKVNFCIVSVQAGRYFSFDLFMFNHFGGLIFQENVAHHLKSIIDLRHNNIATPYQFMAPPSLGNINQLLFESMLRRKDHTKKTKFFLTQSIIIS